MYLSIKQHDAFRTLLMGFEIPFRTYIAQTIITKYPSPLNFKAIMVSKLNLISPSSPEILKKNLNRICSSSNCDKLYQMLQTAASSTDEIVPEDTNVPYICDLNVVSCALTEDFSELHSRFNSYNSYCDFAEDYRFARNRLDHPGSRTLEEEHLTPVLTFVNDICIFLDDDYFLQKTRDQIIDEVVALQKHRIEIPIEITNFSEIPYNESRIVCRENELQCIKD